MAEDYLAEVTQLRARNKELEGIIEQTKAGVEPLTNRNFELAATVREQASKIVELQREAPDLEQWKQRALDAEKKLRDFIIQRIDELIRAHTYDVEDVPALRKALIAAFSIDVKEMP